jgi:hypothetical protein
MSWPWIRGLVWEKGFGVVWRGGEGGEGWVGWAVHPFFPVVFPFLRVIGVVVAWVMLLLPWVGWEEHVSLAL